MSKNAAQDELSYEEAYRQLEQIVSRLESDEPDLDALVSDYEKANTLLQTCQNRLRQAELKIEVIRRTREGFQSEPLPDLPTAEDEDE